MSETDIDYKAIEKEIEEFKAEFQSDLDCDPEICLQELNKAEEELSQVISPGKGDEPDIFKLNELSQKRLDCQPDKFQRGVRHWRSIPKHLIDEDIEEQGEESGFYLLADLLDLSPEMVMIGFVFDSETMDEYYMMVSQTSRDIAMQAFSEEMVEGEVSLTDEVTPGVWHSRGSEKEIEEENEGAIIINNRTFIIAFASVRVITDEVYFDHLDAVIPYPRFKRPDLHPIALLCTSKSLQKDMIREDKMIQTDMPEFANKTTEYEYEPDTTSWLKDTKFVEIITYYAGRWLNYMEETLECDEVIYPFTDDFLELGHPAQNKIPDYERVVHFKAAFQDKRSLVISAATWHPMWAGIIACAYVKNVRNQKARILADEDDDSRDEVNEAVYSRFLVLIWCMSFPHAPKLILESPSPVHALEFCPYDGNILVGGLRNGQIIIWDLKGHVNKLEGGADERRSECEYKKELPNKLSWMKIEDDKRTVLPCAVSTPEYTHEGCVTGLKWLSPNYPLSHLGQFEKADEESNKQPMQFMSCSEDGTICVWDLRTPQDVKFGMYQPPPRSPRRPTLTKTEEDISEFRHLNRFVRPHFRILVKLSSREYEPDGIIDSDHDLLPINLPLSGMAYFNVPVHYTALPVIVSNTEADYLEINRVNYSYRSHMANKSKSHSYPLIYKRIVHTATIDEQQETPKMAFSVGSVEGSIATLSWEGLPGNLPGDLNQEACEFFCVYKIHDGPVVSISRSSFVNELMLSVGGRIFAIWREGEDTKPIYWRQSKCTLVSGDWTIYNPSLFYIMDINGELQVWDLLEGLNCPVFKQNITWSSSTAMTQHSLPWFPHLLSLGEMDSSLAGFAVPDALRKLNYDSIETVINKIKEMIERDIAVRVGKMQWAEKWKKEKDELLAKIAAELKLKERLKKVESKTESVVRVISQKLQEEKEERELERKMEREEEDEAARHLPYKYIDPKYEALENWFNQEKERVVQELTRRKQHLAGKLLPEQMETRVQIIDKKERKRRRKEQSIMSENILSKAISSIYPQRSECDLPGIIDYSTAKSKFIGMKKDFLDSYAEAEVLTFQFLKGHTFESAKVSEEPEEPEETEETE